jgi:hypothetical protein
MATDNCGRCELTWETADWTGDPAPIGMGHSQFQPIGPGQILGGKHHLVDSVSQVNDPLDSNKSYYNGLSIGLLVSQMKRSTPISLGKLWRHDCSQPQQKSGKSQRLAQRFCRVVTLV